VRLALGATHPQGVLFAGLVRCPSINGTMTKGAGVAKLVMGATEFARRPWALKPEHRTVAAFDATMILLKSVIDILPVAMVHTWTNVVPTLPRRRRRKPSINAGVGLASQSRNASWLNTMPRIRNISGKSRRASVVAQAPEHHEGDAVAGF
jgi:hypothetical protein